MDKQPTLFPLPEPTPVRHRDVLCCPHCAAPLTLDNFGRDICAEVGVYHGAFCTIISHRVGNCSKCWKTVELINGRIAQSLFVPVQRPEPSAPGGKIGD